MDIQNYPYHHIGITIERDFLEHGEFCKKLAEGWRGVAAWVERLGQPTLDEKMRLHSPE